MLLEILGDALLRSLTSIYGIAVILIPIIVALEVANYYKNNRKKYLKR